MGVGLAALVLLFLLVDLSELTLTLDRGAAAGVAACLLLLGVGLTLSALRWRLVLGLGAPFGFLWKLYLIGWFCSMFLPTSVGGDAVRAVGIARSGLGWGTGFASIVVERFLGVAALFFVLGIGLVVAPAVFGDVLAAVTWSPRWWWAVAGLFVLAVASIVAIRAARRSDPLRRMAREVRQLLGRCRDEPRRMGAALVVSFGVQSVYVAAWALLASGLGLDVPFGAFLLFVPVVSLAGMLPVTVGGLGVREGAWVALLYPFGISAADAVGFSLLFYLCGVGIGVVGAVLFMTSGLSDPEVGRSVEAS